MDTVERVATRVSQGVVSGLRALAPTLAMAAGRGRSDEKMGDGEQVGGKRFSEEQVATLKGYCGVVDERKIPDIWRTFQATKHIATWRATLLAAMEDWEDSHKGGGGNRPSPVFHGGVVQGDRQAGVQPGGGGGFIQLAAERSYNLMLSPKDSSGGGGH